MKKLLIILLCLPLVYSCGDKEKIKKLEDRITDLEKKRKYLLKKMIMNSLKLEIKIMLRGANGEEYEFWLDFGDELKNILTKRQVKKALTKANDLIMEKIDNPKTYFPDNIRKDDFGNQGRIFITDCCYDNVPDSFVTALMSVSLNNYGVKQEHYNYIYFTKDGNQWLSD